MPTFTSRVRIHQYLHTAISAVATLACLTLVIAGAGSAAATDSISVTSSISIRNGDWIPLPAEDMRRAAGDAALSRLTDAGRLRLINHPTASTDPEIGSLVLEIALIGPAETAKLTIRLDTDGSPTLVSTASISVRSLDHAGIYEALEYVGERAADRLVAKLDLLQDYAPNSDARTQHPPDDSARRLLYDQAQASKRAARYAEARTGFEALVATTDDAEDTLRQLAADELRYGLPLFEAQQALNQLGRLSRPGQQSGREAALTRAEHLYRQIQAENPSSVSRVIESQRALDGLLVARSALANAMRANTLSALQGLRMGMMEFVMMEGVCPDEARMQSLIKEMRARVHLESIQSESADARVYEFRGQDTGARTALRCSDFEIEIVDSESDRDRSPAARR